MPSKREVSLLPSEENQNSPGSKITRWLTGTGRIIIVFTELIVIAGFFSRFWLDRRNADLSEIIRQQKVVIDSTKDFEAEFLSLQERLNTISDLYQINSDYASAITSLAVSTPPDIVFDSLSVSYNRPESRMEASIVSSVFSQDSIINYVSNLSVNPDISSLEITNISKKLKDNKYSLSLFVIFKPSKPKA